MELRQEQERVNSVKETITEQINRLEGETSRLRMEVVNIRKHFWDEVKVNIDTFDAVIIYDSSAKSYGDESLRRLFYTACTRAMHHLQLYSVGEPSPFLRNVPPKSLLLS
ncbi:DNA helicase IV [Bacillus fengqiuensis]|nr:DNA helicase IV [Bacillus fengqiuensis]